MASAAAEPTTCIATRSLKRAGVAVLSAAVKTSRACTDIKVARTFAKDVLISRAPSIEAISLAVSSRERVIMAEPGG